MPDGYDIYVMGI